VRVEVPDPPEARETLVGVMDPVGPDEDTVTERVIVPAKPLWLPTVIVAGAEAPDCIVREFWLVEILKSPTVTDTSTECN
jgi:hypothetical protein